MHSHAPATKSHSFGLSVCSRVKITNLPVPLGICSATAGGKAWDKGAWFFGMVSISPCAEAEPGRVHRILNRIAKEMLLGMNRIIASKVLRDLEHCHRLPVQSTHNYRHPLDCNL